MGTGDMEEDRAEYQERAPAARRLVRDGWERSPSRLANGHAAAAGPGLAPAIGRSFLDLANHARILADWFETRGDGAAAHRMNRIRRYWLKRAAAVIDQDASSHWPEAARELAEAWATLARTIETASEK